MNEYIASAEYAASLQRSIEYHCRGEIIPHDIFLQCPFHAIKLNQNLQKEIQMQKYHTYRAAGWVFSHNENGSMILQTKDYTTESAWVTAEIEITEAGEVRELPI